MARILLVDQSPPERALVRMTLLVSGHQVVEAASGAQAVDMLAKAPVDLILLDLRLPDATGPEAIESLRAVPDRQDTPIVTMVDDEADEDVSKALLAGAVDRLVKPFAAHELKEAVGHALAQPKEVRRVVLDQRSDYADFARLQEDARTIP